MSNFGPTLIAVLGGIIGLAIVAVLVSKKAQTSQVLQGAGSALAGVIGAAVGPVTSGGGAAQGGTVPQGAAQ
jgi:hypothetical protein